MIREQGEARLQIEQKLREIADAQARHRAGLHRGLNETASGRGAADDQQFRACAPATFSGISDRVGRIIFQFTDNDGYWHADNQFTLPIRAFSA